jgi:hypothetical protein
MNEMKKDILKNSVTYLHEERNEGPWLPSQRDTKRPDGKRHVYKHIADNAYSDGMNDKVILLRQ